MTLKMNYWLLSVGDPDITIFGCSSSAADILAKRSICSPDIIIASKRSYERHKSSRALKNIKIVVISKYMEYSLGAHDRGCRINAYLTENIEPNAFQLAIKCVAAGMFVIQKNMEDYLQQLSTTIFEASAAAASETSCASVFHLTKKERVVMLHIVAGKSNKEIAATMFLSEGRVKNIITHILKKLKLEDRTQLAIFAIRNNMGMEH